MLFDREVMVSFLAGNVMSSMVGLGATVCATGAGSRREDTSRHSGSWIGVEGRGDSCSSCSSYPAVVVFVLDCCHPNSSFTTHIG